MPGQLVVSLAKVAHCAGGAPCAAGQTGIALEAGAGGQVVALVAVVAG
jgi:hypothetical protein